MEKISFDTGVKEYSINGKSTLRFNPSDPNLYHRFKGFCAFLSDIENEVKEKAKTFSDGAESLDALFEYDKKVKSKLCDVFGGENDFDVIFDGVNVMAVASNGELIATNFLNGIRPIIEQGVKDYAKMEAKKAVEESKRK